MMTYSTAIRSSLLAATFCVAACSQLDSPAATPDEEVLGEALTVTIMTFNVQNLFDNIDNPDTDDKAYLPIEAKRSNEHIAACKKMNRERWKNECLNLDWSDAVVHHKLSVLAATIKQVNNGLGADIIVFQEVENAAILDRLSSEFLADSGYRPAILVEAEGESGRGIDNAFLSKLPLVGSATLHPVILESASNGSGRTRGILEATFELPDGTLLTGFAVHFPAPYNPNWMRVVAYDRLNEIRSALPAGRNVFAAGDFNTTSKEDRQEHMLQRFVRPFWTVAHDTCLDCPGTHYFAPNDEWSFLDMILYSPTRGKKTTWQIRADSVRLANRAAAQVTADGKPQRYDATERTGVSDHWALVMMIEPSEKQ